PSLFIHRVCIANDADLTTLLITNETIRCFRHCRHQKPPVLYEAIEAENHVQLRLHLVHVLHDHAVAMCESCLGTDAQPLLANRLIANPIRTALIITFSLSASQAFEFDQRSWRLKMGRN